MLHSESFVGPPDWLLAECDSEELAKEVVRQTCAKQQIPFGQLTLRANRGIAMMSKPLALLLADLGMAIALDLPVSASSTYKVNNMTRAHAVIASASLINLLCDAPSAFASGIGLSILALTHKISVKDALEALPGQDKVFTGGHSDGTHL